MASINIPDELAERLQDTADELGCSTEQLLEKFLLDNKETSPPPRTPAKLSSPLLNALVETSPDAFIVTNADQEIIVFNPSAQQMFGYTPDEIMGEPLDILIPKKSREKHRHLMHDFAHDNVKSRYMNHRETLHGMRKDGSLFAIQASITNIEYDGEQVFAAIVRDVSEREAQIEIIQENAFRLQLISENIHDVVCLHEPDGTYAYVTESAKNVFGFTADYMIGKNPYDFFHPEDIPRITESHQKSLDGTRSSSIKYRFRTNEGNYIWVDTATSPIYDDQGRLQYLVTATRNIEHQREIEQSLRDERDLLSNIMETSPVGITVLEPDGQIEFTNRRAEEILGAPKDVVNNRTYDADDWQHTDYDGNPWPDEKQPFVRVLKTKKPVWDVRHAIVWPNGEKVYLAINGAPLLDEDGEISKLVFTVEDYTARKHAQDDLESALAREKEINQQRARFSSIVAHEFRTPLTVIGTTTYLIRELLKKRPEAVPLRLDKIDKQVERLSGVMDDVSLITRLQMQDVQVQTSVVDIKDFLTLMCQDLEFAFHDAVPIQLEHPEQSLQLQIDENMLYHIFINLLSNALKYSPDGDPVIVRYDYKNEILSAEIIDKGIGIPAKDRDNLFQLFNRGTNVGAISGTGIGLVIVKQSVDLLGGEIGFVSEEGVGTQFHVHIPAKVAVSV